MRATKVYYKFHLDDSHFSISIGVFFAEDKEYMHESVSRNCFLFWGERLEMMNGIFLKCKKTKSTKKFLSSYL